MQKETQKIKRVLSAVFKRLDKDISSLKPHYRLGLVFSENILRICILKGFWRNFKAIDISEYAIDSGQVTDWTSKIDAATQILVSYLKERKLQKIPINIGLVGDEIAFRRLYLPSMPTRELSSAVLFEGEKLFPFSLERSVIDFRQVQNHNFDARERIGINLTAAKRQLIETIYDRFGAAGLRIGKIDFLPSLIAEQVSRIFIPEPDRCHLYLCLNDSDSMAVFVRGGTLEFFQQFMTRPVADDEDKNRIANFDALVAELSSFIDLYNGQGWGNQVDKILILGQYTADKRHADSITENLGLPCGNAVDLESTGSPDTINDRRKFLINPETFATAMANPARIRLAPARVRRLQEKRKLAFRLAYALVISLIIAGVMHVQLSRRAASAENELQTKNSVLQRIERSPGYLAYLNVRGKMGKYRAHIDSSERKIDSRFHVLLKELSRTLPDHIRLVNMNLENDKGSFTLSIDGQVGLFDYSPEIILADYVERLNASPFFDRVTVSSHRKKIEDNKSELTFQLIMDARV